jgi:transposase
MVTKRYTQEFKDEAVRLLLQGETGVLQLAQELGVDPTTLRDWKRKYCSEHGDFIPINIKKETPETELARLRRENKRLRMESEILKKAIGIFSEELRKDTAS